MTSFKRFIYFVMLIFYKLKYKNVTRINHKLGQDL